MKQIYEKLYDGYAAPLVGQSHDAIHTLLAPLPDAQRIDLTDALDAICLQQSTDAFAAGLHLGLSLLCDDIRRLRPQQVQ